MEARGNSLNHGFNLAIKDLDRKDLGKAMDSDNLCPRIALAKRHGQMPWQIKDHKPRRRARLVRQFP